MSKILYPVVLISALAVIVFAFQSRSQAFDHPFFYQEVGNSLSGAYVMQLIDWSQHDIDQELPISVFDQVYWSVNAEDYLGHHEMMTEAIAFAAPYWAHTNPKPSKSAFFQSRSAEWDAQQRDYPFFDVVDFSAFLDEFPDAASAQAALNDIPTTLADAYDKRKLAIFQWQVLDSWTQLYLENCLSIELNFGVISDGLEQDGFINDDQTEWNRTVRSTLRGELARVRRLVYLPIILQNPAFIQSQTDELTADDLVILQTQWQLDWNRQQHRFGITGAALQSALGCFPGTTAPTP